MVWHASKPGLAPAGDLLFFASPKKPKEKKGDPMVWVPALRYGQPAVLAENGVRHKLASLKQVPALIRFRLRSSAQPDGWGLGAGSGLRRGRALRVPASPNPILSPKPVWPGRAAQMEAVSRAAVV